ncbi:flavodoxin [Desulfosporosinus meridiei]|uniref:Flavodoxin n=1 Tax=Desulfosporosinus meridiei (strain ATCC BAA-275 / DSM 13257 / KCTC 12902 / NCIMB 13706 / S10) TaxID=768704 RepID=J7IYP3_DESMD|nr:flavodoxin [Desulfosporosinus meridiei]AFQ43791.1 flavodoxin [Desulfosporosinus meridiei DSM 13257]
MYKPVVIYYSYSNTTKSLAEDIAIITDGDIRELIPEKPYSFTYNGATKEVRNEIERGYCPKLLSGNEPVKNYEYIFIGTPNWFKSFAPPILSFLRSADLKGKTIIPFCTHGGGGFGQIEINISKECPNSKLLPGFAATSDFDDKQVQDWINSIGVTT